MPFLCALAAEEGSSGRHVILEPYEQLVNIGEVLANTNPLVAGAALRLQQQSLSHDAVNACKLTDP